MLDLQILRVCTLKQLCHAFLYSQYTLESLCVRGLANQLLYVVGFLSELKILLAVTHDGIVQAGLLDTRVILFKGHGMGLMTRWLFGNFRHLHS